MNVLDIAADTGVINFKPSSTLDEIMQNVRTILTTAKGEVPLDRDFGIDVSILDGPVSAVTSRLTNKIIEAVERYEPRVRVVNVKYQGDGAEGSVHPVVQVVIRE